MQRFPQDSNLEPLGMFLRVLRVETSSSDLHNNTKPAENDNGFACGGASVARILKATIETKQ